MSSAREAAEQITAQWPDILRGSIAVFGDIFGGRIDNIHTVISAEAADDPERLIVHFSQCETLEVWGPADVTVGADVFRIGDATRVRWAWFYYGRPQIESNSQFIDHVKNGSRVKATYRTIRTAPKLAPDAERPAVEILSCQRTIPIFKDY